MEIIESSYSEYGQAFPRPYHVFNSVAFNELNRAKCENMRYLLFKDDKYRMGFIAASRNNVILSPFSAPFGGFSFLKENLQIAHIEKAIALLEEYVKTNGFNAIEITFPPFFYNETFHAKILNVLFRNKFSVTDLELDYYYDLNSFDTYLNDVPYSTAKNLKIGQGQNLDFSFCTCEPEYEEVYNVIRQNRAHRGFPMTMEYADILKTAWTIKLDFFLVTGSEGSIAAAIVIHANDDIVYVPYWGDKPGFGHLKPMNFIAWKVFEYYKKEGKKTVHIGIATKNSIPNYGLCEFKEKIGCITTPKYTYFKSFV